MSLNNYTYAGTIAGVKNQIRNGKVFTYGSAQTWSSGQSTYVWEGTANIANWWNEKSRWRVGAGYPVVWEDTWNSSFDILIFDDEHNTITCTACGAAFNPAWDGEEISLQVECARGLIRLATANTWNEKNTAIQAPLYTTTITGATPITQNGSHTFTISSLLSSGALDNYIGIDEDALITLNIQVPQSGPASGPSTSVSGLSVNSASLSGTNYTIGLTSGTATTSFTTYGIVSDEVVVQSIATNITIPKVGMSTTPTIDSQNNTATFVASTAGYLGANDGGLVLNCYAGALDD